MISIVFLGDISLNDMYVDMYAAGHDPFGNVKESFKGIDYVIGNLECLPASSQGENLLKRPRLRTSLLTLNYLSSIGLNIACLAQNHIYDHLEEGVQRAIGFFEEKNISYLGASMDPRTVDRPLIVGNDFVKIGLLNYVTEDTNPNLPNNAGVFLNMFSLDKAVKHIQDIKSNVDFVFILIHWGGRVEGGFYPDFHQPKTAHALIDAGADLIIGHHSHTIQPYEVYKGKYIFYSLGNFCFSDYKFEGTYTPMPKRRMIGAVVKAHIDKNRIHITVEYFRNHITFYSKECSYSEIVKRRNWIFKNLLKYKFLWKLYFFFKKNTLPLALFITRKDLTFPEKFSRLISSLKNKL